MLSQSITINTGSSYTIKADVEETLTTKTYSGSTEYRFYSYNEKLTFLTGSGNFKPGLPYTAYVRVIAFLIN